MSPESGTPDAEHEVDEALVVKLLRSQHPGLASLPLRRLASGWDNASFRLGDDMIVRMPRRQAAATLIRNEQKWLPEVAERVATPVPAPLYVGEPGDGYPWHWSVVRFFPGRVAALEPLHPRAARTVGTFLAALHVAAPEKAPANPYRGVPLRQRAESVTSRLARIRERLRAAGDPAADTADLEDIERQFEKALAIEIDDGPVWLHGDLHPKNIVVSKGELAAVIDWGDLTSGDPATDLAALWMLFPHHAHGDFWRAYGEVSAELFVRSRAWAIFFGVVLLDTGLADDRVFARIGRQTLWRVART